MSGAVCVVHTSVDYQTVSLQAEGTETVSGRRRRNGERCSVLFTPVLTTKLCHFKQKAQKR